VHAIEVVEAQVSKEKLEKRRSASNKKSGNPILSLPETEKRERNRTENANRNQPENRTLLVQKPKN